MVRSRASRSSFHSISKRSLVARGRDEGLELALEQFRECQAGEVVELGADDLDAGGQAAGREAAGRGGGGRSGFATRHSPPETFDVPELLDAVRGLFTPSERQKGRLRMFHELYDFPVPGSEEARDISRRAVSEPDPDDLWRCPQEHAQPMKVFIPGHEDEPVCGGVSPDRPIAGCCEANATDVS